MKNKIFIISVLILGLMSCNEEFMNLKNPAADDSGSYFTTPQTLTQSVNSIYQVMSTESLFARKWFFNFDLLSNEGTIRQPAGAEFQELSMAVYDGTSGPIKGVWAMLYRMVTRANFALDKLNAWTPKSTEDELLKTRLQGEAQFFLGFANYYLGTLWGDIPLRTDFTSTTASTNSKRLPQAEVYAFAESNLKAAIASLPSRYTADKDNGRATSWAAKTFLGRLYAQQGMYDKALVLFKDVADNGGFTMWDGIDGFEKQFTKENRNSPETIFDCKFYWAGDPNQWFIFWGGDEAANVICTTSARAMEYGFTAWWNVAVATPAVKRFKYDIEGVQNYIDPRAFVTYYGNEGYGGDTLYFSPVTGVNSAVYNFKERQTWSWKKYEEFEFKEQESPNSEIGNQIARLADVKLMVAECLVMTGNSSAALPYLNSVRDRVRAVKYNSLPADKNAAMNIVKHERELELCGEQQRWFDLVRWHKNWPGFDMIKLINDEKKAAGLNVQANFQSKHVLFPIPQTEKDVNNLLEVPNGWN